MSTQSWADRTRIKNTTSTLVPSSQPSKVTSPLPGSDLKDNPSLTSQSSTATNTSRINSSTTPSTPASSGDLGLLGLGDGERDSRVQSAMNSVSQSHKDSLSPSPTRITTNGEAASPLADQLDKLSDQSTQRTSPVPSSSILTLPLNESVSKSTGADSTGSMNVWQIRKAELSKRYQSGNKASNLESSSKTESIVYPVPESGKAVRPSFPAPSLSSSTMVSVVDSAAWPAPSEELGSISPIKAKTNLSSQHDGKVANVSTEPRSKGGNGNKIRWKAIPAQITHNAPLPTNHPASARNRHQHRRESHPPGSKNQGSRSASKPLSNHNSTFSSKSRKNSAPAIRTNPPAFVAEKSSRSDVSEKARNHSELSRHALSDASQDISHHTKSQEAPAKSNSQPHLSPVEPVTSHPAIISNSENSSSSAEKIMRDLAAESVSNRKPGFIPRISPTIQPPAMALSAGPTGTYMGLSNSFKVPDCMPTPSSGPIPFYCATEGASDDHQLHQKPQVNPNLNKALSDLHINAPQGNVWVNDPLVMSDGSAPVLLASTGSESSAAITIDGSSLETLQPSKTTSIASSEQSSNLVFHSEADGISSVADAPNKSASENSSKIIPAPEKGTLESQTGATRLLVFHDSANRSGKAGLNANNHGTTNSAASSSQHHGDAGASRLPRKPREAPSAGRGGHNLSASSGLESTSCSGGNQHDAPNTNYSRETSHRKSFNAGQSGKGHHSNRLGNGGGGRSQGGSRSNNWRATSNVAVNNIGNKGRNSERTPQSGRGGSQKTPEEQHFSWAGLPHYPHHGPTYHKYGVAAEHNSPTSNSNHFVQRYAGPPDSPDTRSRTISTGSIATNPVNHGVHMNSPIATVPHGHQATRYYGPPLNHFSATHYPQPSPADPSYSDQGFYPMQQYYYPSPMPQIINEIPLEENQSSGVPPPLAYPSFDPLERPAPLSVYPYALDPLRYYVLGQCEYYFSVDNLVKDQFLRSQMDDMGWVKIETIASFNRIRTLTGDLELICEVMSLSARLDVDVERKLVRKRGDWAVWLLPPRQPAPYCNDTSQPPAQHKTSSETGLVMNGCGASTGSKDYHEGENKSGESTGSDCRTRSENRMDNTITEDKAGLDSLVEYNNKTLLEPLNDTPRSDSAKPNDGEDLSSNEFEPVITVTSNRGQPTISIGFDPKTERPGQTTKQSHTSTSKRSAAR